MKQKLDEARTLAVTLYEAGQLVKREQGPKLFGGSGVLEFRDLPRESVEVWDAVAMAAITALGPPAGEETFHPLQDSDVLNQPGSMLKDYVVRDKRSRTLYVAQRLLRVALLTYLKHWKGEDIIGWDALGGELHAAICEAIGDEEFCEWSDTTSNA